jgi:hypothetical protein
LVRSHGQLLQGVRGTNTPPRRPTRASRPAKTISPR